jgi:hypothetical protein
MKLRLFDHPPSFSCRLLVVEPTAIIITTASILRQAAEIGSDGDLGFWEGLVFQRM